MTDFAAKSPPARRPVALGVLVALVLLLLFMSLSQTDRSSFATVFSSSFTPRLPRPLPLGQAKARLFSERWSFVRYAASPYETEWAAAVSVAERRSKREDRRSEVHVVAACAMNEQPSFQKRYEEYIRVSNANTALSDSNNACQWADRGDEIRDRDPDVFSYFEYRRTFIPCDGNAIDFTALTLDAPPSSYLGSKEAYIQSVRGVGQVDVPKQCRPLTDAELVEYTGARPEVRRSYIEPLVSSMRHPEHCRNSYLLLLKSYMLVDSGPLKWGLPFYHLQGTSNATQEGRSSGAVLMDPIARWMASTEGKALLRWTGKESTDAAFLRSRALQLAPMSVPRPPRVFVFDLGASTWLTGGGGSSQQWFYKVYSSRCMDVTNFNGWEVAPSNASDVWDPVAGPLKPGYRYFNVPLKIEENSWDNPLRHLEVLARPEDVVIFKIDFDVPLIENAIVEEILRKPHIAALIDDFYFEHHVQLQGLAPGVWGWPEGKQLLSESLTIFDSLRRMGIRAHSWV